MGLLGRKELLTKATPKIEKVDLGNDDFVYVKQMTGRERDNFEQSLLKKNKDSKGLVVSVEQATEDFRAKLAVVTVCNAEGKLEFAPNDYAMLSQNMLADQLEKIVNVAQRLNAITQEDKEAIVKNSSADPESSSNSGSVEN
jgi:hypothetical protein